MIIRNVTIHAPEMGKPLVPKPAQSFGLGDAVAAVATPIARVLGLPCIDPATKQLRPESGCAKRKARLNALTQMQPPKEPPAV